VKETARRLAGRAKRAGQASRAVADARRPGRGSPNCATSWAAEYPAAHAPAVSGAARGSTGPPLPINEETPMKRDYRWMWTLPPPLPPGDAFWIGLSGLIGVVGLVVLRLIWAFG
jgi:hypothetical protein